MQASSRKNKAKSKQQKSSISKVVSTQLSNKTTILKESVCVPQRHVEVDLPRSDTITQPFKSKRERAIKDDLFDVSDSDLETEKPTKKKTKSSKLKSGSTHIKLIVGAYCLGQIAEINALDMTVSLPNQLKGVVTITGISEPLSKKAADIANMDNDSDDENQLPELSKLFKVGQWVRCVITQLGNNDAKIKNKQIELSLIPKLVNCDIVRADISKGMILSASVESIEDHGYILSIGMSGVNVFLHKKEAADYETNFNDGRPLIVGQLLNVSVINVADKNLIIQVTASPDIVSNAILSDKFVHNISSLAPGNLIKVRVDEVLTSGIICKYNGMKCEIDLLHLGKAITSDTQDLRKTFGKRDEITARIVYMSISNEAKIIRLSLEPHVLRLEQSKNVFPIGIQLGELVKGNIIRIQEEVIALSLEPLKLRAYLNLAHLSDHLSPTRLSNIVKLLKPGYMLKDLLVISKNDVKGVANVSHKHLLIEAAKHGKLPKSIQDVEVGSIIPGYVKSITDYAVFIGFLGGFSARAMRHVRMIADHYVASPVGLFYPHQSVICRVISVDIENSRCEVSLKSSDTPITALPYITQGDFIRTYFSELLPQNEQTSLLTTEKKFNIGEFVKCKVKKQISERGVLGFEVNVLLEDNTSAKVKGFIHEDQANCRDEGVKEDDILYGVVIDLDMKGKRVDLAVRSELINKFKDQNSQPTDNKQKELKKIAKRGITVDAVVELVKEDYIIVSLPEQCNTIAFAAAKSYNNRTQSLMRYSFKQKMKAQIIHIPPHENDSNINKHDFIDRVLVTFQQATDQQEKFIVPGTKYIEDFSPGQKVKGTITAVEKYGVFIKINNSSVSGLCHISKLSEDFVKDVSALYKTGQHVTAVILNIDYTTQKVAFGLKNSCFKDYGIDLLEDSDHDLEDAIEVEDDLMENPNLQMEIDSNDLQSQESDFSENDNEMAEVKNNSQKVEIMPLPISSAWKWEDEEKTDVPTIDVVDKTEDLLKHKPEVNADFERLLLGSPNSSYLWINYMAHQLELSEIDKARDIGERALKTINYREEQEKMNVWIALMNLENNFGTDESLGDVLKRALQTCDQKKVYMLLVDIYERSDKKELAQQTYHTMLKKFSQSCKVWTKMGLFHIKHGNIQASRDLLQRSLRTLPKRKPITKFAQMEFKHGEAERGRTIFEGMMSNYPKRVDLWSIYIDMEIKAGDFDIVRRLFKRITEMKFSSKNMKFFFKKWLAFEKEYGINALTLGPPTIIGTPPSNRRSINAVINSKGQMFIFGGSREVPFAVEQQAFSTSILSKTFSTLLITTVPIDLHQVQIFNTAGNSWSTMTANGTSLDPRSGHSAVLYWIIRSINYQNPNLFKYYSYISQNSPRNITRYVNTLIGTANDGHVFPGPCHPFGVVKLGFDTDNLDDYNAGYTTGGKIKGISHLHVSGTGGEPKYGVISQFPVVDSIEDPLNLLDFSSERSFEHFEVGYSKFGLKRYKLERNLS
ncbi:414_t:CDS:10, partial [Scutellospora calospora]